MASISPARPARRAAARRKFVIDESEDEVMKDAPVQDEGDDFTPAPQRSPKRTTRRKTTEEPATPRANPRGRRTRKTEVIEPTQIFDPEESVAPEAVSPTKKPSPRKRKSAAPTRKDEYLSPKNCLHRCRLPRLRPVQNLRNCKERHWQISRMRPLMDSLRRHSIHRRLLCLSSQWMCRWKSLWTS